MEKQYRGKVGSLEAKKERKKKILTKAKRENYLSSCLCIRKFLPEKQLWPA